MRSVVESVAENDAPDVPELGQAIVKAYTLEAAAPNRDFSPAAAPLAHASEVELQQFFTSVGALAPPYDPLACIRFYERSSALRPCVDAYKTNIDGYGHRLEPVINLEAADADQKIADAISDARASRGDLTPVTPEDIATARAVIAREMRRERADLELFFKYVVADCSFIELRRESREEREITGNAFWEVLKNAYGRVVGFARVPARTMRLRPIETHWHDVRTPQKRNALDYETVDVKRRFRSYVQAVYGIPVVYFKEFGDPRVMSSLSGRYYSSKDELGATEGAEVSPANEVIHWRNFSALGPYGVPRWVGVSTSLAGLRFSEEVNASYFNQNGIPAMAILVSGGKLAKGAADVIKAHIRQQVMGVENHHGVLIVEATSDASQDPMGNARVRVELRPLAGDRPQDALFQQYEANTERKAGRQFRLPDLLRGASEETNRAQADAVLEFAESQVFQPERQEFDEVINRRVFADMGIRFWTFASNSPPASDPELLTKLATMWMTAGALTPEDGRTLAGKALNENFKPIDAEWMKQPVPLTLAGIIPGEPLPSAPPAASGLAAASHEQHDEGASLDRVSRALMMSAATSMQKRAVDAEGRLVIALPKALIDSWLEPEDG